MDPHRVVTQEEVHARLCRSRPDQLHFMFEPNAPNWAHYFYDLAHRYGEPGNKPTTGDKVAIRKGRRVGGFLVVSVDRKVHARMQRTLDDIWSRYINCSRAFAHRTKFRQGTKVQSRYQRQWIGQVFGPGMHEHVVTVQVTHDARGNPQRKPFLKQLDVSWLREIAARDE